MCAHALRQAQDEEEKHGPDNIVAGSGGGMTNKNNVTLDPARVP